MAEAAWVKVCADAELAEGELRLVKVGDDEVCIVRLEGTVHALGNACPHYECRLNEGILVGRQIICKCHDARFDAATGKALSAPSLKDLPVYPVRVEAGDVLLGPVEKPRFPKPTGEDRRTFLIVGGGAAGSAAAETLRREGFAGRIVMVTAESDLPYDRPDLSKDFMSGEAKPEWMPLRSATFYANQRIEVRTGSRVASLDPRARTATTADGATVSFDKVLLATGSTPRRLAIPGADGAACFDLCSFADARAIAEAAQGAARVVLVGAGFIGMELASSLRVRGLAVDVTAPEALPLASIVGDRVAAYLMQRHRDKGVAFHMGLKVAGISGTRGAKKVRLSDGTGLAADFVVLGLGVQPVVDYLAGTGLVQDGGVPVDARLETKLPGVYAAGDIAIVPLGADRGGARIEHWVVAQRQGQHAARSMLGATAGYDAVPFFWTRQTGVSLKYVGFTRGWDAIAVRGDVEKGRFLAGYYLDGALRAAAGIGMPNDLTAVELLLGKGIPLSREKFEDPRVDLLALARA